MKKIFPMMIAGMMALTSCVVTTTKEEGQAKRQVDVPVFEKIEIIGSPTVSYAQGDSVSVYVEGALEDVTRLEAKVHGNVLHVSLKDEGLLKNMLHGSVGKLTVHVTSPDLIGVTLTGSGDFISRQPLDTDNMDIVLRGSGEIKFASIICDRIKAELEGSGDIDLNGVQTQDAHLSVLGSGDMDVRLQRVPKATISLVGSGDIDVGFDECGTANCQLTGSGDIELKGSLRQLNKNKSGSGDIETKHLTVKNR